MLKDVPPEERPRERLRKCGAQGISNVELVSLLLRTGSRNQSVLALGQKVLAHSGGLAGLPQLTWEELTSLAGIGEAKAIQLLAGIELGRRVARQSVINKEQISSSADAARLVMDELRFLNQEHFVCLYLDSKNKLIYKRCIFKGSLNTMVVHPREVFADGLKRGAAAIICIHNHPSGDLKPSSQDILVTKRLIEAGSIIGIELVDHLIIGDNNYFSMRDHGYLDGCCAKTGN